MNLEPLADRHTRTRSPIIYHPFLNLSGDRLSLVLFAAENIVSDGYGHSVLRQKNPRHPRDKRRDCCPERACLRAGTSSQSRAKAGNCSAKALIDRSKLIEGN